MGDVLGTEVVAEADSFNTKEDGIYCKEWNINGEKVLLGVKKRRKLDEGKCFQQGKIY